MVRCQPCMIGTNRVHLPAPTPSSEVGRFRLMEWSQRREPQDGGMNLSAVPERRPTIRVPSGGGNFGEICTNGVHQFALTRD